MKKTLILSVSFIIIITSIAGFFFAKKDAWVCKDGLWIREGSPKTSQPTAPCAGSPKIPPLPVVPPESTVIQFYKNSGTGEDSPSTQFSKQAAFFTENLKQKMLNSSAYACLDDHPEKYTIKKSTVKNAKATVQIEEIIKTEKKIVLFDLIASGKEWKIDNIGCPKE